MRPNELTRIIKNPETATIEEIKFLAEVAADALELSGEIYATQNTLKVILNRDGKERILNKGLRLWDFILSTFDPHREPEYKREVI